MATRTFHKKRLFSTEKLFLRDWFFSAQYFEEYCAAILIKFNWCFDVETIIKCRSNKYDSKEIVKKKKIYETKK